MADPTAVAKGTAAIMIEVIALTFQATIGVISFRKIRALDGRHKVDTKLKILFGSTLIAAFCATTSSLTASTTVLLYEDYPPVCMTVFVCTTYYFFLSLLSTLVLRLYITFQQSIFKMTKRKYTIFLIIFVILFISAVITIVLFEPAQSDSDSADLLMMIAMTSFFIFWILFFSGSALAVKYFVNNLSKLAKARVDAMSAAGVHKEEIALDEHQQKLSDLSARYMMLFALCVTSSIVFMQMSNVLGMMGGHDELAFAVAVPDFCVNILCLYLQFGFARNEFNRCCGCLDRKCRARVAKRTRKKMHQHSLKLQSQSSANFSLEAVNSNSRSTPRNTNTSIQLETTHSPPGSPVTSQSPSAASNTMTPPAMTLSAESTYENTVSGYGQTLTVENSQNPMEHTVTWRSDAETMTPVTE